MPSFYNEMNAADGGLRAHYADFAKWLQETSSERIDRKRAEADIAFHRVGITFAVYGEDAGKERLIPFDIVPRIIPAAEWADMAAGLRQRIKALNAFLHDIYHDQEILAAGRIPAEQVLGNRQYRPEMRGVDVPGNIYAHIAGVDIVRAGEGSVRDNQSLLEMAFVGRLYEDDQMMAWARDAPDDGRAEAARPRVDRGRARLPRLDPVRRRRGHGRVRAADCD